MTEEVQKYVIIGNGFDLNLGIKSSYGDFVESVKREYHLSSSKEVYEFNNLFVQAFDGSRLNWSDFETEFEKQIYAADISTDDNSKKTFNIAKLNESIQRLEDDFYYYLNGEYSKWRSSISSIFARKENINPCYLKIFENAKVISFNFTDVLNGIGLEEIAKAVFQVHGSLKNKDIIFGGGMVGTDKARKLTGYGVTDNDKLVRIRQDTFLSEKREELIEGIEGDGNIDLYLIGHSIAGSDMNFLAQLLQKARKIYLFYFEKDYQIKLQALIQNFDRDILERVILVPFLDILDRATKKYLKFNLSEDKSSTKGDIRGRNEFEEFRRIFNINIPQNKNFEEFWLSASNFPIDNIRKIEINSLEVCKQLDWIFSNFTVERDQVTASIPIVIDGLNNSESSTYLSSLLGKPIFSALLFHSKSVTIRDCRIFFSTLWNHLKGSECERLILEKNQIDIDANEELDLSTLSSLRTVDIVNNNFYTTVEEYEVEGFSIVSSTKLANRKLNRINCTNNKFDQKEVAQPSLYNYAQFAYEVRLPYLNLDYTYNKFHFNNVEQLELLGASTEQINKLKGIANEDK